MLASGVLRTRPDGAMGSIVVSAVPSPQIDRPVRSNSMAVPPKMENHTSVSTDGTTTMPTTNSRMVRPREMRARNMPTNGVHEIHQAQ